MKPLRPKSLSLNPKYTHRRYINHIGYSYITLIGAYISLDMAFVVHEDLVYET